MGKGEEWVAEADLGVDGKGRVGRKVAGSGGGVEWEEGGEGDAEGRSVNVKVFDSMGKRLWGDEDSLASTQGGSEEWMEKEVV